MEKYWIALHHDKSFSEQEIASTFFFHHHISGILSHLADASQIFL